MKLDYSTLVGNDGAIAKSGRTIYDVLHDAPEHLIPSIELEAILKKGLLGLNLNYPLPVKPSTSRNPAILVRALI